MAELANGISRRLGNLLRQADATPDAELLGRFVDGCDGEAFALLVRRHGPMVHGVCRRILRNHADADDAFQATFLVLVRRARAVRPRALLGNWLYGVAYRTALEARRAAAVRRVRERSAAEMRTTSPATDSPLPDMRETLDQELEALPDVYRAAVILCDLEGLSRKDAALRLGWSEGTLSGRLSRARSLLAGRLSRRGLALPLGGISVLNATATAGVPSMLLESTTRIGILVAAGEAVAVAPASVAALTEGVMKAMLLTKLKGMAMTVVVGSAILATAVGGWQANATGAGDPQTGDRAKAPSAQRNQAREADKDRIAELERERDQLLRQVRQLQDRLTELEKMERGVDPTGRVNEALLKQLHAELAKATASGAQDMAKELANRIEEQLRRLQQQQRASDAAGSLPASRGAAKDVASDLLRKAERAKAAEGAKDAAPVLGAQLRRIEEERARTTGAAEKRPGGDRMQALEERLKQMADEMQKLRQDVERLRAEQLRKR